MKDIQKLETSLWEAADNLRANSKLTSSDYFMPVLGIIFLRHAANRFESATKQIEEAQTSGEMPPRAPRPEDYIKRRALYLPESARYDNIMEKPATERPQLVTAAMNAIEASFEPLRDVLPKDYGIFEPRVLDDLMRKFNSEQIKAATGDVFGRIYEYFLAEFSMQKAYDNGEFFTPPSLVQTIVNVIEPDHGIVFDPACGSGGMFVQSSHFIEQSGDDTAHKVVFYGQEKTPGTIRLTRMNLAVHGLDGKIAVANTFYEDQHELVGRCDFVMANPPFNVDLVDAEMVKSDPRLPFGLPGINKNKKVPNGNYLWISYFWSYLNAKGRAGFVMSSQASSAGNEEKKVRQKLVETGGVDVMISIGGNFFYTRTVPCELWFFDRGKPEDRCDQVLMIDARHIYRKLTRSTNEFSPEQLANLSAIVWLYRGQPDRFLGLVQRYLTSVCTETAALPEKLDLFHTTLECVKERIEACASTLGNLEGMDADLKKPLMDAAAELREAVTAYQTDRCTLLQDLEEFGEQTCKTAPGGNQEQHAARVAFDPLAERLRGLARQLDLLYKLAARSVELASEFAKEPAVAAVFDKRGTGRLVKRLEEERIAAAEQIKGAVYFHRQLVLLQERFPEAKLRDVPGLVKLVSREDIEAADWSLTPGRYVGVAPVEEDQDFDFEQTMRDIHVELADLNREAVDLAAKIRENFEGLGI